MAIRQCQIKCNMLSHRDQMMISARYRLPPIASRRPPLIASSDATLLGRGKDSPSSTRGLPPHAEHEDSPGPYEVLRLPARELTARLPRILATQGRQLS